MKQIPEYPPDKFILPKLGNTYEDAEHLLASKQGGRLLVYVKYNGLGVSDVRFIVDDREVMTSYARLDDAIEYFNRLDG